MDDNQNKNNNEDDEFEEVEVEYEEYEEEEDEQSEGKKKQGKKRKRPKRSHNVHNNKKQKKIDITTNITNEEKKQYNDRDIKETKFDYLNEIRENNKERLSQINSDKLSKNSFENTSQYKSVRDDKRDNQTNYLNESDSNLNRSTKFKLLGLKNNIKRKKSERFEKDLEQLKVIKEIYIKEIMKLRNELDNANLKLIKELKEKNNLLRLFDEISNKLNSHVFRTFSEKSKLRNSDNKVNDEEDLIKLIELKEKEYNNLIKENAILKNDIRRLKSEIRKYKTVEKIELLDQNCEKDRQIHDLKKLNEEQKRLLDDFKYEQLILHINNEMDKKEGIINSLNNKLTSLSLKMKNRESPMNSSFNSKFNYINNYSAQRNKRNLFHSFSKSNVNRELKKNKSDIFKSGSNFYNLFDEKERNAINTLFDSTEELNNFKAKIENIEKRNDHYERMLKNENNELLKKNRQKEEIIRELNEKEKEHLKRINDCKVQLITNRNVNDKLEKIIKRKDETENIYRELLKRKEDEVQKLIQEKIKLIEAIQKNRKDLRRVNMLKSRDKDLQSFKDELGVINVIDVDKYLKPKKNEFSSSLLIQKNDDIYYKGLPTMDRVLETEDENEESSLSKERKIIKRRKRK